MSKNITIQVWTDLFFARFIAFWRPEEEANYTPPSPDTRSEQEKNIPFLLVTSSVYQGRSEVIGLNPVAPSQHPMPKDFLEQQIRHISYMFANQFGIFQPPSRAIAEAFLAKMKVGYTLVKELNINVSSAQGDISLKDLRDSLAQYSDQELKAIKIAITGENTADAINKGMKDYIHSDPSASSVQQYISITKLIDMYKVENPYISTSLINNPVDSLPPGTESAPASLTALAQAQNSKDLNQAELNTLKTYDAMIEKSKASDTIVQPSKEQVLQQQILDMQKSLGNS